MLKPAKSQLLFLGTIAVLLIATVVLAFVLLNVMGPLHVKVLL